MSSDPQQIDSTIDIVTPENIAFQYRVAGPFRRFPAFALDVVIRIVIVWILVIVLVPLFTMMGMGSISIAIGFVFYFLLEWFYGGLFETYMNGQTPGKWMLGIRVVTVDGQPIDGMQAVMRNVFRFADLMPPAIPTLLLSGMSALPTCLLGLVVMASNRRFQRLGDLVCGTIVVIEERQWHTGMGKIDDPRAYQLATYLPTDLVVPRSMAKALSHYVERRRYFSTGRRREVARHLAEPLLAQFGFPADTSHDLLLCSVYYRIFIADRGADERHVAEAAAARQPVISPAVPATPEIEIDAQGQMHSRVNPGGPTG